MAWMKFDPRLFVSPPYIICPKCGKKAFGILTIGPRHYSRRCKECLYPSGPEPAAVFPLPELHKKVVYIDQFAISEMMKSLNPKTTAHQQGKLDEFWTILFERLDSLCKLQLVICPDSLYHMNESLMSPFYGPLKRMYELLSNGISFYDRATIERFQIYDHAKNWISGVPEKRVDINIKRIVHGDINAWQDRIIISIKRDYDVSWIDQIRKEREKISEGLVAVFERWRSEKDKSFEKRYEDECMEYGKILLRSYIDYFKLQEKIAVGQIQLTMDHLFPPDSIILIHMIQEVFREAGVSDIDIWPKTFEYLTSPYLKDIPFLKISSMLLAALARKAAAGRKRPPNRGMINDISILSSLLPYCDAMFIDNECHSYLREQPLCEAIDYRTLTFCQNNKEEFIKFLNDIEQKAPKEHIDKVMEVYGADCLKPYTTIYKE